MTYITRELERKFLKLNDFFKENGSISDQSVRKAMRIWI